MIVEWEGRDAWTSMWIIRVHAGDRHVETEVSVLQDRGEWRGIGPEPGPGACAPATGTQIGLQLL